MTPEVESSRAVPVFLFRAVPEKITLMCFIYQLLHLSWTIKVCLGKVCWVPPWIPPCHWNPWVSMGFWSGGNLIFFSTLFTGPLSLSWSHHDCQHCVGFWFLGAKAPKKKVKRGIFAKVVTFTSAVGKRNSWRATRLEGWLHQPSVCSELRWSWDSNQFNVLSNGLWFLGWFMLYKCHYAWE